MFWENFENLSKEFRRVRVILEKISKKCRKVLTLIWLNLKIFLENIKKLWQIFIKILDFLYKSSLF